MKRERFHYFSLFLVIALLAPVPLIWAYSAEGSFDRTLHVSGPVELEVSTGSGSIEVGKGNATEVRVHGIIKVNHGWWGGASGDAEAKVRQLESNPPILQQGNFIRIGRIEDPELRRNVSISYQLEVPQATQLKAATGSGNVSVDGVHGPVKATSGSGNLRISNIGDQLVATTGSGDVTASAIEEGVHLTTGSGSIRATDVAGQFFISTGSGDITLKGTRSGGGRVSTGSGTVQLSGINGSLRVGTGSGDITAQGEPAGDWTLHTGSGNIAVQLPQGASFDVDAHTDSGRIITKLPMTVQGSIARGTLRGTVGKGGPRLELRAGSGDIQIGG